MSKGTLQNHLYITYRWLSFSQTLNDCSHYVLFTYFSWKSWKQIWKVAPTVLYLPRQSTPTSYYQLQVKGYFWSLRCCLCPNIHITHTDTIVKCTSVSFTTPQLLQNKFSYMMHIQFFDAQILRKGLHGVWMNTASSWSWIFNRYNVQLCAVTLLILWLVSFMLCFCS